MVALQQVFDSTTTRETLSPAEFLAGRADWWDQASCHDNTGDLTALFFSEEIQDIGAAKRICAECPVLASCLEGALARREPAGVWGGQIFRNGRILETKRRRGRPPKNPRPEDEMPHIPIPEHLRPAS